jgi:hypothetical protein
MYSEFANDPKVQRLSEADQRRYIMLLCIKCNGDVTVTDCDVAFQLRISDDDWASTKTILIERGLVTKDNQPSAWEKRQQPSDSSAARVAKHRESKKNKCNGDVTVNVTNSNSLEEKRREENRREEIKAIAIGKPNCPHQEIINLYHEILPVCPRIKDWTPARASTLKARWNEAIERQDLGYWKGLFEYIAGIPFLTGQVAQNGRKPFYASLEWILKAENFAKIREGRYA